MNGLQNYNFEGNQVPVKLVGEQPKEGTIWKI